MLIQVDFYRKHGKWYSGGEVEIDKEAWDSGVLEAIIKKQQILTNVKDYYIVVNDLPESRNDRNYRLTYARLYTIEQVNKMLLMMEI